MGLQQPLVLLELLPPETHQGLWQVQALGQHHLLQVQG
jgi:hypothetical protein